MRQSQLLSKTSKQAPKDAQVLSHKLLVRADFIAQLASGVYSFLPLGYRVYQKIAGVVRQEMDKIGGQEILMPTLQPKELWQKSGRWGHMDPPLFVLKDRHKREFVLGPTHEEVVTSLVASRVQSYKDLPLYLYQIQNKFRNEMRFTGGLLRAREFLMKDMYSFHADQADFERFFKKVLHSYHAIFKRCGIKIIQSEASGGVFTKEKTYEFQVLSDVGEDRIIFCSRCAWAVNEDVAKVKPGQKCPHCKGKLQKGNTIETGHTFRLGTKYAQAFGLSFLDRKGKKLSAVMGCYGIGLGRLMAAIVEMHHDEKGMLWPKEIAPFQVHLIHLERQKKVAQKAEQVYAYLQKAGVEVLYDDRTDKTPGEKFADADLIGIPWRIVISERTMRKNSVEIKRREKQKTELVKGNVLPFLQLHV